MSVFPPPLQSYLLVIAKISFQFSKILEARSLFLSPHPHLSLSLSLSDALLTKAGRWRTTSSVFASLPSSAPLALISILPFSAAEETLHLWRAERRIEIKRNFPSHHLVETVNLLKAVTVSV